MYSSVAPPRFLYSQGNDLQPRVKPTAKQNEDEKFEIIRAIKEHNNPTLEDIYKCRVGEVLKKVFVTKATEGFNVMTFENSRGRSNTFRFFESKGIELVRLDECELADSIGDFEDDEQIDESLYKEDIHYNAE